MSDIIKIVLGVLGASAPFVVLYYVVRTSKRNKGSTHGGGIERYRDIGGD